MTFFWMSFMCYEKFGFQNSNVFLKCNVQTCVNQPRCSSDNLVSVSDNLVSVNKPDKYYFIASECETCVVLKSIGKTCKVFLPVRQFKTQFRNKITNISYCKLLAFDFWKHLIKDMNWKTYSYLDSQLPPSLQFGKYSSTGSFVLWPTCVRLKLAAGSIDSPQSFQEKATNRFVFLYILL